MTRRWRAALVALVLVAACSDSSLPEPVVNSCLQDFECLDGELCERTLGRCVAERASAPYPYVVQVVTNDNADGLVERTLSARRTLERSLELGPLAVPRAVRVRGSVLPPDAPDPIPAEIAFYPQSDMSYLAPARSVFTRVEGTRHMFTASLDPNTTYEVRVIPLSTASRRYPPSSFTISTQTSPLEQPLALPTSVSFSGRLLPETSPPPGQRSPLVNLRVRMRAKESGEFVSSVTTLGEAGEYTLYIAPKVLSTLAEHELVLDLNDLDRPPWVTTLAIDGVSLRNNAAITIPNLPVRTQVRVRVQSELGGDLAADLTFLSSFQPPPNELPMTTRDWCRPKPSNNVVFRCATREAIAFGGPEKVVELLPGYYEIFVSPNSPIGASERATTKRFEGNVIPTEDGMPSGPVSFDLSAAELYTGAVQGPQRQAMPLVSIAANALNIPNEREPTAAYNRTSEVVSGAKGEFRLPVDIGSYDLVATPPEGTGFPWFVYPNRFVSNAPAESRAFAIDIAAPVVVRGRVVDAQNRPIYSANVEAFLILQNGGSERALRIARTTSSDAGTFALLMPPSIKQDFLPNALDGGVPLDAGSAPR